MLEGKRLNLIRQFAEGLVPFTKQGLYIGMSKELYRDSGLFCCQTIDFGLSLPDEPPFHQPGNRTGHLFIWLLKLFVGENGSSGGHLRWASPTNCYLNFQSSNDFRTSSVKS